MKKYESNRPELDASVREKVKEILVVSGLPKEELDKIDTM